MKSMSTASPGARLLKFSSFCPLPFTDPDLDCFLARLGVLREGQE